jgi:hypothetical protein
MRNILDRNVIISFGLESRKLELPVTPHPQEAHAWVALRETVFNLSQSRKDVSVGGILAMRD